MAYQGQWQSGDVLTATDLNTFTPVTVLEFSGNISDATETLISFTTEIVDVGDWHSNSTNPSRITPDVAGTYLATGHYSTGSSGVDYAFSRFYKNGSSVGASIAQFSGTNIIGSHDIQFFLQMNGTTDYLEYKVYQASGAGRPGTIQFALQLVAAS